jgi:outer membrane receptor protein involved in Fe transport
MGVSGLLGGIAALAQEVTGSISGTVVDKTGAAIKGASVVLTDTDRDLVVRTVPTNGAGFYTATALPLGNYKVVVNQTGFGSTVFNGIVLHANDTLTLNTTLTAGSEQSVTVSAEQTAINLETAAQATVIDGTQVRELVLSTRNYEQLVGLQPGVAYTGGDQIYIGNSNPSGATNVVSYSVNGARTSANAWTVDGADNEDRGSNYTLLTYPSVDAIAEFKTLRGNYSAEYGRTASGQVNVITKSGTADFHGDAYEFVRNDLFNANAVLNKLPTTPSGAAKATSARSILRYNDFGYTFGGPVLLPKYDGRKHGTFFFFSQELRRVILYNPITLTGVPSLNERQGIFNVNVCDAALTTAAGTCTTTGVQTVPITSVVAQAYLKDIYANVGQPDSTGTLVLAPQRNIYNGNQQIGRIDQSFGTKLNVFFRIINDSIPTIEPGGLFQGSGYPGVNTTATNAPGRIYLGHATYIISPKTLIEGGYALSHGALLSDPVGTAAFANSPDVAAAYKTPGRLLYTSTLPRVPTLTFNGGPSIVTYGPYRDFNRNHNVFAHVTHTFGNHTVSVGVDYNHYNKQENNASANAGSFAFNNGNKPAGSTAQPYQQAFANFLSGFVTTFSQASFDVTPNIMANQYELYAQDDWKVTPRLTLNLGVRYSHFGQPTDGNHDLTTFDPSLYNAANAPTIDTNGLICVVGAPCTGTTPNGTVTYANAVTNGVSVNGTIVGSTQQGVVVAGSNSPYGNQISSTDKLNFAPRVGFALDVFGDGKTSLRGGYGLAYDSSLFGTYEQNIFQNPPFVLTPSVSNTCFDAPGCVAANVSYAAQLIRATSPHFHTPYDQQYSLSVQHDGPFHVFTELAYVGSTQTHLIGLVDINEAPVGAFAAANPGVTVTSSNTSVVNRYRPYKGFQAINSVNPIFSGNYNALQVSTKRQFSHGSEIGINYTYSKALTNANADRTGAPQISSNISAEYGRAAADRRNIFNVNAVYVVPYFYEQKGIIGHILGGWEVSGLAFVNSGLPLNVTSSSLDPAGVGFLGSSAAGGRPDRIGNPNADNPAYPIHTRQHWFNVGAFAAVPAGQIRGGNAQRNIVEGPGWWRADAGVFKNVTIFDRVHLQLRGEAYNVFNHTNPDGVASTSIVNGYNASTNVTSYSSTAGNITSYRDKRILQLGAKVVF